jgi:macrolide-specific efflux system membrane fusion protein
MKSKLFAIVALVAVGGGATYVALGGLPTGNAAASSFLTAEATKTTVTDDAAATGSVEPSATYGLAFGSAPSPLSDDESSPEGGRTWAVTDVAAEVGGTVQAGEVLARADTNELEAEIAAARDTVRAAEQQLLIAEDALDDAAGTDARRQARIAVYNARTALSQARKTWNDLRAEKELATLRSPIDGIVSEVNVVAGADAPTGPAVVVQDAGYVVTAEVVESDLPSVELGQEATVAIDAIDIEVSGTVTAIAPQATTGDASGGVVTFAVTVALEDPPESMRPGMTADITITLAKAENVVAIPAGALLGASGDYSVRVLKADATIELRQVSVGLLTNTMAEITDGLAEGETVITGTASDQNQVNNGFGSRVPGGGVIVDGGGPEVITRP